MLRVSPFSFVDLLRLRLWHKMDKAFKTPREYAPNFLPHVSQRHFWIRQRICCGVCSFKECNLAFLRPIPFREAIYPLESMIFPFSRLEGYVISNSFPLSRSRCFFFSPPWPNGHVEVLAHLHTGTYLQGPEAVAMMRLFCGVRGTCFGRWRLEESIFDIFDVPQMLRFHPTNKALIAGLLATTIP